MESYFVVKFDHATGKFSIDNDTMDAHFSGNVFDGISWIYPENLELESDERAMNDLQFMLEEYNKTHGDDENA